MDKTKCIFNNTEFILYFSLAFIGCFNEYISCIVSVLLIINIIITLIKRKQISFVFNSLSAFLLCLCAFYFLSFFWAIDKGMAFIGFIKFLPLALFLLSASAEENWNIEKVLPFFIGVLCIVSVIGMQIRPLRVYFSVADRLAGVFEYPNTFALLILIGELLLYKVKKLKLAHYILFVVLILSLLYTGSRTVFALFIIANIVCLFLRQNKAVKKAVLIMLSIVVVLAVVLFVFRGSIIIKRYFRFSLTESTFVGRLLYYKDALPLILKHPFGLGYMGYSYIEHSIQSGMYTVKYIHNDLLQIMLDVGWIPAVLYIVAIVRSLMSKEIDIFNKVIISVVFLHSCFDFDLQFISIFFILILLMKQNAGKKIIIKSTFMINSSLVLLMLVNIYMGIALSLANFGARQASDKIYSFNTENKIAMLEKEEDVETAVEIAQEIQNQNTYSYIPYSVMAKYYYSVGDFTQLIENKNAVFERNPFDYKEYEEYCRMLIYGIMLYSNANDKTSVKYCQNELVSTVDLLESNRDRLSNLGKKIKDQPKTKLPEDIMDYVLKINK
ncbi:MAG: O-antigen ligase family protein [Clostridia bacterium]|nr:O-antigen ligase family protein [Clostridia bacterium]